MNKHYLLNCIIILFFISCRKDRIDTSYEIVAQTQSHYQINDIYFVNKDTGYAVGGSIWQNGIMLKTADGGENWELVDSVADNTLLGVFFINSQYGFVVGHSGRILRTYNAGASWDWYPFDLWYEYTFWPVMNQVYFIDSNKGFIAANNSLLLFTKDGGNSWQKSEYLIDFYDVEFYNELIGWAGGYGGIIKTVDGGNNWQYLEAPSDLYNGISFIDSEIGYVAGYQGQVIKTLNGGEDWEKSLKMNKPYVKRKRFTDIKFINSQLGYATGYDGLLLKTDNGGDDWDILKLDIEEDIFALSVHDNYIFVGTSDGKILKICLSC